MNTIEHLAAAILLPALSLSSAAGEAVDPQTGLVLDAGYETVKANCTACHSPKLITQNKASRDGWLETIRWMQAEQNLRQFDPNTEKIILDYLAKNYAPREQGRRLPLQVNKWYLLNDAETAVQ